MTQGDKVLGSKMLDTILIGISTLVACAMTGIFAYTELIYQKPLINDSAAMGRLFEDHKAKLVPKTLNFKKVIVNIQSHRVTRLRYIETSLDIVPMKPKYLEMFEKKKAQILDAIINVMGRMSADELNSISGKILLESRIKKQVDKVVGGPSVKEVYFSKFVIQ